MTELTPPQVDAFVELADDRRMAVAEYGPPTGRAMVWFHGTPGGRRQIPQSLRRDLDELDVRLLVVERPGYGSSSPHAYDAVRDVADDIEQVLDALGVERLCVGALSGGGPYALACAHELDDRVVAVSVLGGVTPRFGPAAVDGGAVSAMAPLGRVAQPLAEPLGKVVEGLVAVIKPLAPPILDQVAKLFPRGDQDVFAQPEIKAMFIDDIVRSVRGGLSGPAFDLRVFVRPWGFEVADIDAPVHLWHGDEDTFVTLEQAERMAEGIPNATFEVRHGESHLGGFAVAEQAVEAAMAHWDPPAAGAS